MAPDICPKTKGPKNKDCFHPDEEDDGAPTVPPRVIQKQRPKEPATPGGQPLLPTAETPDSRNTIAPSEDQRRHELRSLFPKPPTPKPKSSHLFRPSLASLRPITSVRNLLKAKSSKNGSDLKTRTRASEHAVDAHELQTVVRNLVGPKHQVNITGADIRNNLLSDGPPEEGGYDPDAELIQDAGPQVRRTPSKRPSLRSIQWTSSSLMGTPESAKSIQHPCAGQSKSPYQLSPFDTQPVTRRRYSGILSTPDLRLSTKPKGKLRKAPRKARGNTPTPIPRLSLELPGIDKSDAADVPWAQSLEESFLMSICSPHECPGSVPLKISDRLALRSSSTNESLKDVDCSRVGVQYQLRSASEPVSVRVHQAVVRSRDSTLQADNTLEPAGNRYVSLRTRRNETTRESVHLHSMRISHHLRSGSLLSGNEQCNSLELLPLRHGGSVSEENQNPKTLKQSRRHGRASSSGFAGSRVPSKRDKATNSHHHQEGSSIYSSRPHSPPDSLDGSVANSPMRIQPADSSNDATLDPNKLHPGWPAMAKDTPTRAQKADAASCHIGGNTANQEQDVDQARKGDSRRAGEFPVGKESRFREALSPSMQRKRSFPAVSIMTILRPRRSRRSQSAGDLQRFEITMDGPSDGLRTPDPRERQAIKTMLSFEIEKNAVGKESREANPVWEQAFRAYQDEKASFLLAGHKDLATQGPIRERSGSINTRSRSASKQDSDPFPPSTVDDPTKAPIPGTAWDTKANEDLRLIFDTQKDDFDTLGAWGRYPSHTREQRTGSAGPADGVRVRDFALEAAIRFAEGKDKPVEDQVDNDKEPDLITRLKSRASSGGKKQKKKLGSVRVAKSASMNFARTFFRDYSRIFASQSAEFQRHGHGHRTSIAAGKPLEYPELEILPDVWRPAEELGRSCRPRDSDNSQDQVDGSVRVTNYRKYVAPRMPEKKRTEALASITHNFLDPDLALDGTSNGASRKDRARVWSLYYKDCLPGHGRRSEDVASISQPDLINLERFEKRLGTDLAHLGSRRHSFDCTHDSAGPGRLAGGFSSKHSRNVSGMSKISLATAFSGVPSFVSLNGVDGNNAALQADNGQSNNLYQVRRSTLDLLAQYREQEGKERERVLSMLRSGSVRSASG